MRLRGYDYAMPGMYFVTICTAHRACLFGEMHDDEIVLSPAGQVVESWWGTIPVRFPTVELDAMVVMPNHIHGVLMLPAAEPDCGDVPNLSEVVRWFKSHTTRDYIRGVHTEQWPQFEKQLWQPRFHDHIVRSDAALDRIRRYIEANPSRWPQDDLHPEKR